MRAASNHDYSYFIHNTWSGTLSTEHLYRYCWWHQSWCQARGPTWDVLLGNLFHSVIPFTNLVAQLLQWSRWCSQIMTDDRENKAQKPPAKISLSLRNLFVSDVWKQTAQCVRTITRLWEYCPLCLFVTLPWSRSLFDTLELWHPLRELNLITFNYITEKCDT